MNCENNPQIPDRSRSRVKTGNAEILADLARVKAVFQMRTLEAIIRGGGR